MQSKKSWGLNRSLESANSTAERKYCSADKEALEQAREVIVKELG